MMMMMIIIGGERRRRRRRKKRQVERDKDGAPLEKQSETEESK
jgi:hypothetical protein